MSAAPLPGPADVVAFWKDAGPEKWFRKDADFDAEIRVRFAALHAAAAAGALDGWAATPEGALALVLVLDQFSRNLMRGAPGAFAQDDHALRVARAALDAGHASQVDPGLALFFAMPFMHSERIADQRRSVGLIHALAPANLGYARDHEMIVRRFGRFPHRNDILGRATTDAERDFLAAGGFSG